MNKVDNPRKALIQSFKIPTQYKNYILFEGRVIIKFTDQSNFYYLVYLIIKSNLMKNIKDITISIFAIIGFVTVLAGFTPNLTQTNIVKLDSRQFEELNDAIEDGFREVTNKLGDVNIGAIGNNDTKYMISEGDGKWLINVKTH